MKFLTIIFPPHEKKEQNKEKFWKIPELKTLSQEFQSYQANNGLIIKINKEEYTYQEPLLSEQEKKIYNKLEKGLYEIVNVKEEANAEEKLRKTILLLISELNLKIDRNSFNRISYYFQKNLLGFGKLEPLLKDPLVLKILYNEKTISLKHSIFGICKTKLTLNKEEEEEILRKALTSCNQEWPMEEERISCENASLKWILQQKEETRSFNCEKKKEKYTSPEDIIKEKKMSIEMFAYLWMLIEDKRSIFIENDRNILQALSFFIPPHSTIKIDTEDFPINQNTKIIIGESLEKEDYAFLSKWTPKNKEETCIASTKDLPNEIDTIICYTESGRIKSIKEYGKELFKWQEEKFLFSLEESMYIASKGNKIILLEEFKTRTKLLNVLFKNHLKEEDFKKVICAYYENSQLVLKKAGIQ